MILPGSKWIVLVLALEAIFNRSALFDGMTMTSRAERISEITSTSVDEMCKCRTQPLFPSTGPKSSCSGYSTSRGSDQRVLSYSLYLHQGDSERLRGYITGLRANLWAMRRLYPGFVLRLYYRLDGESERKRLCRVFCKNPDLDLCDVTSLETLGNVSSSFGMVWRFAPMSDPTVSEWHSRDLDSVPSEREAAAVDEWRAHPDTPELHVMRDHFRHGAPIMGGMFGMRRGANAHLLKDIFRKMLNESERDCARDSDQLLLHNHLYTSPIFNRSMLAHDSYYCRYFTAGLWLPWPTRRPDYNESVMNFVGSNGGKIKKACPLECRPKEHPDWTMC